MCWFENAYFLKNHKNCFIPMTKTITASILQKKPKEKQSQPAEKLTEEDATFTSERKQA